MDWWTIVLAVGGLFVSGFVLLYVTGITSILRVRLQPAGARLAADGEVAPAYAELYAPEANELARLGFTRATWMLDRWNAAASLDVAPALVLLHEPSGAFATLSLHDALDDQRPVLVELATYLAGGRVIRTYNQFAHALFDEFTRDETIQDPMVVSLALHVAAHADTVSRSGPVERIDIAEHVERMDRYAVARFAALDRSGDLRRERDHLVPTFRLARRWFKRLRAGEVRRLALKGIPPRNAPIPASVRAFSYLRAEELHGRRTKRVAWVWILLGSGVAFAASMIGLFDVTTAIVLLPVVLLHEVGHWVAMRLTGYRNVSIFFVPFFGGAAIGDRVRPTLAKELFVLLAGPVPGLLLALPVASIAHRSGLPLLDDLAQWLVLVNLANLLPLYPLDGGRIAHDIFMGRSMVVPVALRAVAIAFFVVSFFVFDDTISLVLALMFGLAFPTELRLLRLESALRRAGVETPDLERVIAGICDRMAARPAADKRLAIKRLLDRLAAPSPSIGGRFAAAAVYGTLFVVGGSIGVSALAISSEPSMLEGHSSEDLVAVECGRDLRSQLADGEPHWLTTIEASFDDVEKYELVRADVLAPVVVGYGGCTPWDSTKTSAQRSQERRARRTLMAIEDRSSRAVAGEDEAGLDAYFARRDAAALEVLRERAPWLDERTVAEYRRMNDPRTMGEVGGLEARLGVDESCAPLGVEGLVPIAPLGEAPVLRLVLVDAGADTNHAERAFEHLCSEGAGPLRAQRSVAFVPSLLDAALVD